MVNKQDNFGLVKDGSKTSRLDSKLTLIVIHSSTLDNHKIDHVFSDNDWGCYMGRKTRATRECPADGGDVHEKWKNQAHAFNMCKNMCMEQSITWRCSTTLLDITHSQLEAATFSNQHDIV